MGSPVFSIANLSINSVNTLDVQANGAYLTIDVNNSFLATYTDNSGTGYTSGSTGLARRAVSTPSRSSPRDHQRVKDG